MIIQMHAPDCLTYFFHKAPSSNITFSNNDHNEHVQEGGIEEEVDFNLGTDRIRETRNKLNKSEKF